MFKFIGDLSNQSESSNNLFQLAESILVFSKARSLFDNSFGSWFSDGGRSSLSTPQLFVLILKLKISLLKSLQLFEEHRLSSFLLLEALLKLPYNRNVFTMLASTFILE